MFYAFDITIPKSTTKSSPITQLLKLTAGIVTWVGIQFPSGCWGLAHCYLWHRGHQWLPTNPEGDFSSNGYVIPIVEYYELGEALNIVKFVGWNLDDTWGHTITVYIDILPKEALEPDSLLKSGLKRLLQLVGVG